MEKWKKENQNNKSNKCATFIHWMKHTKIQFDKEGGEPICPEKTTATNKNRRKIVM